MNSLTAFGVVAVAVMLIAYALEDRSPRWVLVFAAGCAASAVYAFLAGAWPFTVAEALWVGVALRRWWLRKLEEPLAHRVGAGQARRRTATPPDARR